MSSTSVPRLVVLLTAALVLRATSVSAREPVRLLAGEAIRQCVGTAIARPLSPSEKRLEARLANPSMGRAWIEDGATLVVRGTSCGRTRVLILAGDEERASLPVLFVPPLRLRGPGDGILGDTVTVEAEGGVPPYALAVTSTAGAPDEGGASRAAVVTPRSPCLWDLRLRRPGELVVRLQDVEAQATDLVLRVKPRRRGEAPPFRATCADPQVSPGQAVLVSLEGGRPPYRAEGRSRWIRLPGTRHRHVVRDRAPGRGERELLTFLDAEGRRAELRLELVSSGPLRFRFDREGPLRAQRNMTCEILGGRLPIRLVDFRRDLLSVVPVGPRRFAVGCLRAPRDARPVTFRIRDGRGRRLVVEVPLAR